MRLPKALMRLVERRQAPFFHFVEMARAPLDVMCDASAELQSRLVRVVARYHAALRQQLRELGVGELRDGRRLGGESSGTDCPSRARRGERRGRHRKHRDEKSAQRHGEHARRAEIFFTPCDD
jgi:hypothetical protein